MGEIIITVMCNISMLVVGVIIGAGWKEKQEVM